MSDYTEFNMIAYDSYILRLYHCRKLRDFDEVMFRASNDSDVTHRDFIRLTNMANVFMRSLGLKERFNAL